MDVLDQNMVSCDVDKTMEDRDSNSQSSNQQNHMWCEQRQAAVHEEIRRMNQLPTRSTYVTHRLRVLNKILQLMSIQKCITGSGAGIAICWVVIVNQVSQIALIMSYEIYWSKTKRHPEIESATPAQSFRSERFN